MTTSAIGKSASLRFAAFTLVELLAVVAIMAIVMGVLGLSLRNMQGPSTQVAAAQVASGLSLARQIAISKNTETRFVIYGSASGATGAGLPPESWRYWTVISSNKSATNNMWVMEKEWEKLPEGVVFLNIATGGYSTIEGDPVNGASIGQPFTPRFGTGNVTDGQEWTLFASFGTFGVSAGGASNTLTSVPVVGYLPTGEAVANGGTSRAQRLGLTTGQTAAVRVAEGFAGTDGTIRLLSTNNWYYVETDKFGRVRVRARESYRK
jgi:prepilin-type N-terminal cleavage/methylation domain-containing protein